MEINEEFEEPDNEVFLDIKFVEFTRLKNGYLKQWVESYLNEKDAKKNNFDLKQLSYILFALLFLLRILRVIRIGNNRLAVYLGSPWNYLGGNRFHNEFLFLFWTTNIIASYVFLHKSQTKQYKWLEIFAFLSGLISHKKIGLTDEKIAIKFMKITEIVFRVCYLIVNCIASGCFIVSLLAFALNYNLSDFLIFGTLWTTLLSIWGYMVCEAIYWMPGYYFIVCYYLRLRLNAIESKLKDLLMISKRLPLSVKSLMVRNYLEEHNKFCQQVDNYNKYWRKYLTICVLIFITLICFLTYLIFISPIKWFLGIEYSIILAAHLSLVFTVTYSASTISHSNKSLSKVLNAISTRTNLPLNIKLMLSNYIEKLDNNKIGFTFINDVLITRRTFEFVIYNLSVYFLLLVENTLDRSVRTKI